MIGELESLRTSGRKGYGTRTLLGACLVKALFGLPTWTLVAALIAEHPGLQAAIGGAPSCWAMYRFGTKLRDNRPALEACLDALAVALRETHPDFGRDVAIDSSHLCAFAIHARGFRPETMCADKGYDVSRVYAECEDRGVEPVIPLKGMKGKQPVLPIGVGGRLLPRIQRHTERFRDLYARRRAVESAFADLKTHHGLTPLRVRGLARVQLHADLTILARLAQALARTRTVALAA